MKKGALSPKKIESRIVALVQWSDSTRTRQLNIFCLGQRYYFVYKKSQATTLSRVGDILLSLVLFSPSFFLTAMESRATFTG